MDTRQSFDLTRQFAVLSFVSILLIGTVAAFLLSQLFTGKMIARDAAITQEFLDSIVSADSTGLFFDAADDPARAAALEEFFDHVAALPDVVRANVYAADRRVLWSSDATLVGRTFAGNRELDAALRGELVVDTGVIGATPKLEHGQFEEGLQGLRFIEAYMPIWNDRRFDVVGVVELYKLPRGLHNSIVQGQRLIWGSALSGGVLLFFALFWIVRRADRVMQVQQQRLLDTRSLSMIGETASAVAHAMRNPLASIRASAELTLIDDLEGARESAADIISEADRLNGWARDLLQFSAARPEEPEQVDVNELVGDVIRGHKAVLGRPELSLHLELAASLPLVRAHDAPLSQALGNLIMNAVEAMNYAGNLYLSTALGSDRRSVLVSVRDEGPGLPPEVQGKVFRPFVTTKPTGTGLGLALSRRLVEHYGGTLEIHSQSGTGVTACLSLPAVRRVF